ncbi:MAG: Eco57I restriction-modification methylase domain-containing protein [Planctomycetaceae bacterium]|nr:Eco57I restriction-modification methylase domain-containing protein [Planctomycetaceae bacterium]
MSDAANKTPAPKIILDLVARFRELEKDYLKGRYNETQLRRDFLDPFFKTLGWDMTNESGHAEAYRDVIHEDSIKIKGGTKAPDYCMRLGGVRKFFVEAKKPSVKIKDEPDPAYQVRRYGWSAKLPLSILSDFQEFAVYDCRIKPKLSDKASNARINYMRYEEYPERWHEIASVFSKDALLKGSFDRYADTKRGMRGTATVDDAFLEEIEKWRNALALEFKRKNPKLSARNLNFAVQLTIDRIIFLRICEDRGIERYGQLQALTAGPKIYERLFDIFRKADDRYNSGLFHFSKEKDRTSSPDELTPRLKLDDKVLKPILKGLYYPDCPYEFSVLSADILGHVYEQFLGKVITLTSSGARAKVEEKPEVRKAGGVYYTPTYIVDYIVKNTVGKLLGSPVNGAEAPVAPCAPAGRLIAEGESSDDPSREGAGRYKKQGTGRIPSPLTPAKAADLKILDPACGSGSFLIGAYQYLLDWHLNWYTTNDAESHAKGKQPKIYRDRRNDWRLTVAERKRILLNNIYGVDIDSQAVEVTKLSLLLKVLEGESEETLQTQQRLFHERALPDLSSNIKCGNSLIGPDFYKGKARGMFDDEETYRVNAFDWQAEFKEIFSRKNPGFDAVIGNPPYVDSEYMKQYSNKERDYCTDTYSSASGNWDLFCVFVEKIHLLSRQHGFASMIIPNKLGSAEYASSIRRLFEKSYSLHTIRDYSKVPIFPVAVYPMVFVSSPTPAKRGHMVLLERMERSGSGEPFIEGSHTLCYEDYFSEEGQPWRIFSQIYEGSPVAKMSKSFPPLQDVAEVLGAATVSEAYEIKNLISEYRGEVSGCLRVVNSGTIDRYQALWETASLRYLGDSYSKPIIRKTALPKLPPKRLRQAQTPKIIIAGMTKRLECVGDTLGIFVAAKSTSIVLPKINIRYLLGVLNSRAVAFYYNSTFGGNRLQGGYLRIGPPQLRMIPIPIIETEDFANEPQHEALVSLVDSMLDLHRKLPEAKTDGERTMIQRQIDATDREIDQLVYQLYGLTPDEIRIVEEATK